MSMFRRWFCCSVLIAAVAPGVRAGALAAGGTETTFGTDVVHTFTSNGTFTVTASAVAEVQILLVGGGGAGGSNAGGGGGAGGVVYMTNQLLAAGTYTVNVGTGGLSAASEGRGGAGGDSSFASLTNAFGGGGGGCWNSSNSGAGYPASAGGSGGGAGSRNGGGTAIGSGIAGQGHDGGTGSQASAGGGGGAAAAGANSVSDTNAGRGGDGVTNFISGAAIVYGGGGAGGFCHGTTVSAGGAGGGGAGASQQSDKLAVAGTDGLGGGGGGGSNSNSGGTTATQRGARGGSGIVIVRYSTTADTTKPAVRFSGVSDVTNVSARLTGTLVYVGSGVSSCTVKAVYGLSADDLYRTNTITTGAVNVDAISYTLGGLAPGRTWYVALLAENSQGAFVLSPVLSFTTLAETPVGSSAGLYSGTLSGAFNLTNYPSATNVVLYPVMATTTSGWGANTTYIYWGRMYFNGGAYRFATTIDDSTYLAVTTNGAKAVLLNVASGYNLLSMSAIDGFAPAAGWYDFELRVGNGGGGAGPSYSQNGWTTSCGFAYSINNLFQSNFSYFALPRDPGDGSLFLTPVAGRPVTVGGDWSWSAGALSANLTIGGGAAATLYLASGTTYGGGTTNGWTTVEKIGDLAAVTGNTSLAVTAHDVGSAVYARFFVVDVNGNLGGSETLVPSLADVPRLGAATVSGIVGDGATVSGTVVSWGAGSSSGTVVVEYGTSSNNLPAVSGAVTPGSDGSYVAPLSGLLPGVIYYYRVKAANAAGHVAVSSVVPFRTLGAAFLSTTMSAVDKQKSATFTGSLMALGAGTTSTVYLVVGQGLTDSAAKSALTAVTSQVVTATGSFTFTWPVVYSNEVAYTFLCSNSCVGVSLLGGTGATNTFWASDTTVYTWKGGSLGNWSDTNNWTASRTDGVGFPIIGSTASYVGSTVVTTRLTQAESAGALDIAQKGLNLTFIGGGSLVVSGSSDCRSHTNVWFTLDGATFRNSDNGKCFQVSKLAGGLVLTNGATLTTTSVWCNDTNDLVHVSAGCVLTAWGSYELSGKGDVLWIDDGYVYLGNSLQLNRYAMGPVTARFSGPGARMWVKDYVCSYTVEVPPVLEFVVPLGGYTNTASGSLSAPLWNNGGDNKVFAAADDKSTAKTNIVISVPATSPAFIGAGGDFQLVAWGSNGMKTNALVFAELPNASSNYFYYTYDSKTNHTGTTVTGLGVHIAKYSPPAGYVIRAAGTDLTIPYDWATNACPGISPANTAAMTNALVASGANGVLRWQSYALGLDSKDPASVVLGDARNDASASSVTLFARNVNPATATGLSVRYVLEGSHDGATWTDLSRSDTNALSVSLPSGYLFFRVRAEILIE